MPETYGGERSPEDEFIEQLGLVDAGEIERARRLLSVYRDAIVEVNNTEKNSVTLDDVRYNTHFTDDLDADSLGFLEVLEILQEKLDVDVPIEPFEEKGTVTAGAAFEVLYGLTKDSLGDRPEDNPEGNGPESGDREPRTPMPSAPSSSVSIDLPN